MPMFKKSMVVLVLLVLAAAGGALYSFSVEDTAVRLEESALPVPSVEAPSGEIVVYVSGEVANPGVVRLAEGSRAIDAVNACGGVLPTADMNGINMAQSLKDGMQLIVSERQPAQTQSSVVSSGGLATEASAAGGRVNINQADVKGLQALPGIGPAMAQKIVDYRTQNGSFQVPEDIQKVKGIGPAKFEKMKDRITTN